MMLRAYVALYLAFLFAPIVVIVLFAFHASPSLILPYTGFSLRWFDKLLADRQFVEALTNSLIVAAAASVITCVLGTFAALALTRLAPLPRKAFSVLSFAPVALPGLFLGVALLVLFDRLGIYRSLWTVTVAHVLFCLPFFIETVRTRVAYFDRSLEEAARDLGAGPLATFRRITLPILAPTLIGGTILTFALSFDELVITVFVIGEESTLPFYILSMMRRTVDPSINAASVIALVLSTALLAVGGLIIRAQRKRAISLRASEGGD